jgi:hypothetical protein
VNTQSRVGVRWAVLAGVVLVTATACRAGVGPAPSVVATGSGPVASASAAAVTAPVGAGTGGAGSMTVSITSPVAVAGHVDTAVSCQVAGRRYAESAAGAVGAATVAQSVRIAAYTGPGTYSALVTVSVAGTDSSPYAVDAVPATVEVTTAGGSLSFNANTASGNTLAGSISWACS